MLVGNFRNFNLRNEKSECTLTIVPNHQIFFPVLKNQ